MQMKDINKPTGRFLLQYSREASINISRFQMDALQSYAFHLHECRKEAFKTASEQTQSIFL